MNAEDLRAIRRSAEDDWPQSPDRVLYLLDYVDELRRDLEKVIDQRDVVIETLNKVINYG